MDRPVCVKCQLRKADKGKKTCYRCCYKEGGKNTVRGMCERCGQRPKQSRGQGCYYTTCWKCRRPELTARHEYRASRKAKERWDGPLVCSHCGFEPKHPCQMDVDHKDGNRNNNDPSNHQLLCANCHRLKTIENGDHLRRYA